jgi:hypothetical protein
MTINRTRFIENLMLNIIRFKEQIQEAKAPETIINTANNTIAMEKKLKFISILSYKRTLIIFNLI